MSFGEGGAATSMDLWSVPRPKLSQFHVFGGENLAKLTP